MNVPALHLADDFAMPLDAVTETFVVLAAGRGALRASDSLGQAYREGT